LKLELKPKKETDKQKEKLSKIQSVWWKTIKLEKAIILHHQVKSPQKSLPKINDTKKKLFLKILGKSYTPNMKRSNLKMNGKEIMHCS
jgi:hypothetical protein